MSLKIQDDYLQRFFSIAKVFSSTTRLATVVVDVNGKTFSDCHNFNSFCALVRVDKRYCVSRQECDKYCAFEGLKHLKPRAPSCHTGLSLFSMPLIRGGHLYGFMLYGQVRAKYQEYKTIVIDNRCSQTDEPKIKAEQSQIAVVDNNALATSANSLNFIADNLETEQQQLDEFATPPTSYTRHYFAEPPRHKKKPLVALRYINENLCSELSLGSIAAHVCLGANYFSRLLEKRQGVNFKTWVNQKEVQKAGELLHDPIHSIDSTARKLQYAQTSCFCRAFRAAYQMSPQSSRHAGLSQ